MSSDSQGSKVLPFTGKTSPDAGAKAKLARLPAPVHQVQEKGKQYFQKALRALFDNADDALFALADRATNNNEQNLYFESMREVRIRRRTIESEFAKAIDQAFAKLVQDGQSGGDSPTGPEISADNLSLVENEELEELVAVDNMINRANERCGESLQYLSLRLDSLVPIKVYQKNNPVGPDVVCHIFVDAAQELDADIKAKLVLFKLFDKYVVKQMPAIYDALNQSLVEANVLPSLQHQRPRNPNPPTGQGTAAGPAQGSQQQPTAQGSQAAGMQGQPVNAGQGNSAPGAPQQNAGGSQAAGGQYQGGVGQANAALIGALSELQSQQIAEWRQHPVGSVAAVQQSMQGMVAQLQNHQQMEGKQSDVINLVKLLFEFILDDRNLADPMKALLGRLQIPILKVAILDQSFFNKSGHPARRLLNEMATAALGWQEDPKTAAKGEPPSDPLYRKISSIVNTLLDQFEADVSVFNELLADFVSFVEKERRRASLLEQRIIDAEDGKAKAEAARQQVADALNETVGDRELPPEVKQILDEAWSNVMFLICLREGTEGKNWQAALKTADDLVWSVTTPVDAASRKALMTLLPNLVKRLRQGLEKISYNPFEMTKLLGQLEKLHMARLKGPVEAVSSEPVSNDEVHMAGEEAASENRVEPKLSSVETASNAQSGTPAPSEAAASDSADGNDGTVTAEDLANVDQSYLTLVSKLTQGTWFEMSDGGDRKYRCRLAAIIKTTGKYIFVNRSGMKVAEKNKESLAVAMKQGDLRLLDDTMLFDRALESVIGNSRKPRPNQ